MFSFPMAQNLLALTLLSHFTKRARGRRKFLPDLLVAIANPNTEPQAGLWTFKL